jgi:hypothetical protein
VRVACRRRAGDIKVTEHAEDNSKLVDIVHLPNCRLKVRQSPIAASHRSINLNSALCDTLFELGLTQIIREPTHTHGNILDLLVTNQPEQISELLIDKHTCSSTSDHHLITYTIKLKPQNVKKYKTLPQSILLHSKADFASISNYIDRQNLTNQIRHQPITDAWNTFLSTLTTACDLYTPTIRPTTCKSPKWFTPDIKHQINQIRSLCRCIKKKTVQTRLSRLTHMETKLKHSIHSAKLSYETNLLLQ